jgi:uncharacterized protein YndB with AHSA1/START domain
VPQTFSAFAYSAAAPDRVFAILADGSRWSQWAGPLVMRSWWDREGDPPPAGVGAIRRLGTRQFASREEIVAYDPPRHLAYTILSGQPVRHYRADVQLTAEGTGTRIEWRATFEPLIPGTGRLMRAWLATVVRGFARRLAAYAESR